MTVDVRPSSEHDIALIVVEAVTVTYAAEGAWGLDGCESHLGSEIVLPRPYIKRLLCELPVNTIDT